MPFLFFLFIAFMGLWLVTLPFRILFRIVSTAVCSSPLLREPWTRTQ